MLSRKPAPVCVSSRLRRNADGATLPCHPKRSPCIAHLKWQRELRLALGQGGQPRLVFSTVEGNVLSPDNLSRDWGRMLKAKKLPRVSFHSLRHTHASMLIRAGVDILTVSRRLGHGKPSVTLDCYGHLVEGSDAAAAKAIEGLIGTPRER